MKTAHSIFTVLFWLSVAYGAFNFVRVMGKWGEITNGYGGAGIFPIAIGALLGSAILPGIFWTIRYFIGKKIKNEQNI